MVLHLMHEDLKLNKLREAIEAKRLAKVLVKLALSIDPYQKAAYVEYYIKEHNLVEFETEMKKVYKDGLLFKEGTEIEQV